MKWIIDYALNRCVISIYAWLMLGFTQPYKASRVKSSLVLEITTTAHIAISLCFNNLSILIYSENFHYYILCCNIKLKDYLDK